MDKILVEIRNESGLVTRKKYPIEEDTVVIDRGKRGRKGSSYKPKFDNQSVLYYKTGKWPFKRLHRKLLLMEGANKCVSFKDGKLDKPVWSRETERELFEAEVLKRSGEISKKVEIPTLFYIMMFALIMLSIINIIMTIRGSRIVF